MGSRTAFISYDYDNDRHYKNLLVAWDKNKEFGLKFYDTSVDVSVNSSSVDVIKRVISERINKSTHLVCIVGANTHKSTWVAWEIRKAIDLNKKIVAVKTAKDNQSPVELYAVGAKWALSFTFDSINSALYSV